MSVVTANEFMAKSKVSSFYDWIDTKVIQNLVVVMSRKKYGLINVIGESVCPCIYDEIIARPGYFKVRIDERWGAIDLEGESLCPCDYPNLLHVDKNGVYCERDDDVYYIKFKQWLMKEFSIN